ncbi:Uncharacterised protein [Metamycoplasma cloacale]|uniref:Uncharacterized protein n=1 Tax=Metamycoplasma cloacale TaxID=92401 RepID=A0A2Z4LLH4_9BACT|nr:hypothetical protein [Metamycoplasma cloacale]AWX42619.1 hypothetical protein DK849_00775 [Metamycoplasma cloacale]VEU79624.1 Uncharacterised protein [Metamycoplasma cloacale]
MQLLAFIESNFNQGWSSDAIRMNISGLLQLLLFTNKNVSERRNINSTNGSLSSDNTYASEAYIIKAIKYFLNNKKELTESVVKNSGLETNNSD